MIVAIEKQNDGTYIAYNMGCDKFTAIGSGATIAEAKEDFFNSMEEMKETYQELEMEVIEFETEDVITTSTGEGGGNNSF